MMGRPIVQQVKPVGTIGEDHNLNPRGLVSQEVTADRLEITDTDWIKPPMWDDYGTQGTLPNDNWNKYSTDGGWSGDHNNKRLMTPEFAEKYAWANATPPITKMRLGQEGQGNLGQQQFPGQLEMFDREPTWHSPGRPSDL